MGTELLAGTRDIWRRLFLNIQKLGQNAGDTAGRMLSNQFRKCLF